MCIKLDYFFKSKLKSKKIELSYYIKQRRQRFLIKHSKLLKIFKIGDIIEFVFHYKNIPLIFRGICISIKRKYFILPDVIIVLRNVIIKIGIELTVSYYYNRLYKLKFLDYKRKFHNYTKNKLFFIRKSVNKASQID
jgi:ribosomal protein L19